MKRDTYGFGLCLLTVLCGVWLTLSAFGCAGNMPPNLTPVAVTAWHQTQAQKPLDLLRDMAIDANAQVPPLVSTKATTAIVEWHKAAILTIHAAASGWQATVKAGLESALANLTPAERASLAPYITLVESLLAEVAS